MSNNFSGFFKYFSNIFKQLPALLWKLPRLMVITVNGIEKNGKIILAAKMGHPMGKCRYLT